MAARLLIVFLTVSWCISCVQTHGSIKPVIEKVDRMDDDLLDLKMDLPRLEEQFHNEIDFLKVSLRADLLNNMVPEYMEKQVKDYIVQSLRSQSLGELLNSQIGAEVRQLKRELHLMKRKYQRLSSNLRTSDLQRTEMTNMLLKRNEQLKVRVETLENVTEKAAERLKHLEMENSLLNISLRVMNVSLRDEVDGDCGCGSGGNKNRTVSDRVETLENVTEKAAERLNHLEMENSLMNTSLRVMNATLRDEVDGDCGCGSGGNKSRTVSDRVETLENVTEKAAEKLKHLEIENSNLNISLRVMNVTLRDEVDGDCGCGSGGNKNRTVSDRVETLENVTEKATERLKHLEMENSLLNISLRVMNISLREEVVDRVGSLEQASREERKIVKDDLVSRIKPLEQGRGDESKRINNVERQYSFLNRSLVILSASLTAEVESECGCSLRGTKNETIATRFQTLKWITTEADKRLQSLESANNNTINSLKKMNVTLNAEIESECGCATMRNKNGTMHTRVKTLERVSNHTEHRVQDLESKSYHLKSSLEYINQSLSVELGTQMFKEQYTCLLLVPHWSRDKQFLQLSIRDNTHKNYMYLDIQLIEAIAYDPKSRKLFISRYNPNKIYSSQLDTPELTLLREGIASYGMAVDVIRQILFMMTYVPTRTVSRMSVDGKHFIRVVDLTGHGSTPRAITVDPRHRQIYVTMASRLLSVDYTGSNLHTLTTGSNMYSLIMDYANNWLYYNDKKKVMRRSLNGTSTMVTELTSIPRSYQFYNNTLYIGHSTYIDAVYFIDKMKTQSRLKSLTNTYLLCLVPDP